MFRRQLMSSHFVKTRWRQEHRLLNARGLVRHSASHLLQPWSLPPPKADPSSQSSRSHRLLVEHGFVRNVPNCAGMFYLLPLATRCLSKLSRLIDSRMEEIGCQKILLPTLTPGEQWQATGRWSSLGPELLKTADRHNRPFVFSPTHEEAVTSMVAALPNVSHRSLPLRLYQISSKFRDEGRPRFGLLRGREFIMKDLYAFDKDVSSARETYSAVTAAYEKLFREDLRMRFFRVLGDTGDIGGSESHEFHVEADVGQDEIVVCEKCLRGRNVEVLPDGEGDKCPTCDSGALTKLSSIEVGHTFLLGSKYSSALNAVYVPEAGGKKQVLEMSCYGLGVTRIVAAAAEALSSDKELRWPTAIAPFSAAVLMPKPGSKEHSVGAEEALSFYDIVNGSGQLAGDVLLDDRDGITVGGKLREAFKTGYPFVVLFGKDYVKEGLVEVHDLTKDSRGAAGKVMQKLSLEAARDYLISNTI